MPIAIMRDTHGQLRERINDLRQAIKENSEDISEAASFGDLSENAEYDSAKERQSMLHYKLNQLQQYMNVEIFDEEDIDTETVSFGTAVTLKDNKNGKRLEYCVVGPAEYELENYPNIMSYKSSLARAMMGKEIGDKVEIKKPDKHLSFTIEDIQSAQAVRQDSG
ncbi:MAG TPA: GreA/GreB family elongation factor [bacterium]|nr:GreA/GreB family elongation factor [bacterium]